MGSLMRSMILFVAGFLLTTVVVGIGMLVRNGLAAGQPVAVDPLTQCRAYLELVIKDRANAQAEAAYFAARVHQLEAEVKALKDEKGK